MTIKIEKDVPLPERAGKALYPFQEMEVGDSFHITEKGGSVRALAARQFDPVTGLKMQFTTRREGAGWRVWRVK